MEENAQLIVDKQNRSAYKFSLLSSIHLFYSIWENVVLSRDLFPGKFTFLPLVFLTWFRICVGCYFWTFAVIYVL